MNRVKKLVLFFLLFFSINVYAEEYLPIEYNVSRFMQTDSDGSVTGTNIWWVKIPAKYKMHYAYSKDVVDLKLNKTDQEYHAGWEKPSLTAKRHGATIAVNCRFIYSYDENGNKLGDGVNTSNIDFYNLQYVKSKKNNYLQAVDVSSGLGGINFDNYVDKSVQTALHGLLVVLDNNRVYYDENNYSGGTSISTNRQPRTFIAIDGNNNQYVMVATGRDAPIDGDSSFKQAGLTFDEEFIFVRDGLGVKNIKYLINLDGGGSSSFVYKGNMINPKYDSNFTVERAVPGIFYWKVDNYTINYDLNGGSFIKQPVKSYNVDSSTIKLEVPTRSNYVFMGWKDTKTNSYVSSISNGSSGNKSFRADWKKDVSLSVSNNTYYISNNILEVPYTYNGNGRVSCSSTNKSFTCEIKNNKVKITSSTTGQTTINLKSSETNDYVSKSTSFTIINNEIKVNKITINNQDLNLNNGLNHEIKVDDGVEEVNITASSNATKVNGIGKVSISGKDKIYVVFSNNYSEIKYTINIVRINESNNSSNDNNENQQNEVINNNQVNDNTNNQQNEVINNNQVIDHTNNFNSRKGFIVVLSIIAGIYLILMVLKKKDFYN